MKIGIEAEGKLRRLKTLFVKQRPEALNSAVSTETLASLIKDVAHIYFGADKSCVATALEAYNSFERYGFIQSKLVTFEVAHHELHLLPAKVLSRCHVMVRIETQNILHGLKPTDTIMIETPDSIYCVMEGQFIKNDILYLTDKEVLK